MGPETKTLLLLASAELAKELPKLLQTEKISKRCQCSCKKKKGKKRKNIIHK